MHGPARARSSPKTTRTPPIRRLRVVPKAGRSRPRAPFVVLVVVLMALGLVGLLLINTTMQRGAFELTELQDRAETLHTREQALQLEVSSMTNPDHIATQAARLGMVPSTSPAFLRLPDGKTTGRPSPALPGTNLPGLTETKKSRDDRNGGQDGDRDRNGDGNGDRNQNENQNRDGNGDRDQDRNRDRQNNGREDGRGNNDSGNNDRGNSDRGSSDRGNGDRGNGDRGNGETQRSGEGAQ